ncbi:MAG: MATE family efflux transporter [Christensenellales bacterium]|jgi:putative MATE family efflux protein
MQHSSRRWTHYVFGDRIFYGALLAIVLPMIVQNSISSFVNLLDNIMVGQIGTEEMAGVSIANNLIFIYNICIFGGISGASIFGAQFYGAQDYKGVRDALRFKFIIAVVIFLIAAAVFYLFAEPLLSLFLSKDEDPVAVAATLRAGKSYLLIMIAGHLPFALAQAYASTLREAGETMLAMTASIAAVLTNLVGNYILIFGHFGAPRLGVSGAAIATVLSRFVEIGIIMIFAHKNHTRYFFLDGLYRTLRVPAALVKRIATRGLPLLANEAAWAFGMSALMKFYAMRGLNVVAGMNVSSVVSNLFNTVVFAMGGAAAILVGQALGADDVPRAKTTAWRLISFSVMCSVVIGALLLLAAPYVPQIYKVNAESRALATDFMVILALTMPLMAFAHCCYFTLRAGGKTVLTFLFDCVSLWLFSVPLVYILVYHTGMSIQWVYAIAQLTNLIKCVIGFILVKKGVWIDNIARVNA